jgi:hypothetical protein
MKIDKIFVLMIALFILASFSAAQNIAAGSGSALPQMFTTSDQCMACHNGLISPSGEDVSIGSNWSSSMMAHAARDPYWQASVRRETLAHASSKAAIENECSACHMPMTRFRAKASGMMESVFANLPINMAANRHGLLAADGVSCTMCHQIEDKNLGDRASFTAGFSVDTRTLPEKREIFGPFEVDSGRQQIMRSSSTYMPTQALHIQSSEFCATCHTLFTHSLGPGGEVVGELPEQVPYLEWKHSSYRDNKSCQDCHMPVVAEEMPITGVMGQVREGFSRHIFRGGNFFMVSMLNRHRGELGVTTQSREMDATARRTMDHLETGAARVAIENAEKTGNILKAEVSVRNLAGHKLPTAYPSRRTWIHFTVSDRNGNLVFESGAFEQNGSIKGNDNDLDATRFEPHYMEVNSPEEVQIYEVIMAAPDNTVTTGLLKAVRYVKDNRILPAGFDKSTADHDVAVNGAAENDDDFQAAGDRITYRVNVDGADGPFNVRAELYYQSIGYRWAQNLQEENAPEIDRFVSYYDSMAGGSSAILARDSKVSE